MAARAGMRPRNGVYPLERILNRTLKTETCWLWQGRRLPNGYGITSIPGHRPISTHRASWILHYGSIPDGLWVLHRCDVKHCIRPDHLFLGTPSDNLNDARAKERWHPGLPIALPGALNPAAKLTSADVVRIRALHAAGTLNKMALARELGVSATAIYWVVQGRNWVST